MSDLTHLPPPNPPGSPPPRYSGPRQSNPPTQNHTPSTASFSRTFPTLNPRASSSIPTCSSAVALDAKPQISTLALKALPSFDASSSLRRLVGKGYFELTIREDVVYHILAAAWKTEIFEIEGNAPGIFVIDFVNIDDKDRILPGAPWFVANKPFILREWNPLVPISWLNFDVMPLWVRILDLPPSLLSVDNVELIGPMFDKLLEVDAEVLALGFCHGFMHFKVLHDLRKPIIPGFLFLNQELEVWVPLFYEKIGDFYYKCGRLTHTKINYQDPPFTALINGDKKQIFGSWLRRNCRSYRRGHGSSWKDNNFLVS